MTLASDGTLSGTPTQAGTFGWIVSATDTSFCMHSALFQLTVDPNPEAGSTDAGSDAGSPGADFDAAIEAGTDAAIGAGSDAAVGAGNDAAVGTGTDAAPSGDGAATGADAATGPGATGADAAMGADAAIVDAGSGQTTVDALGQTGTDAGATMAMLEAGDDSSAQTSQTDANSAPDSGLTGTPVTDAGAPLAESGGPNGQGDAMGEGTTPDASPESAAAEHAAGCACHQSRQGGSSWPLGGIAIVVLALRRRSAARRGRMRAAGA
jgi:hypothetical protein